MADEAIKAARDGCMMITDPAAGYRCAGCNHTVTVLSYADGHEQSQKDNMVSATVLVVEDELAIQELIAYTLQQAGHQPLRASTAEHAMQLIQSAVPDVVL